MRGRESRGPGTWRVSARSLDYFRTRAIDGRVLTPEEIAEVKEIAAQMRRPSSTPKQPSNPGRPSQAPTRPDKNPPMPPNPPRPK